MSYRRQNGWSYFDGPIESFDCLPYDLLMAKLDAYGFSKESSKLIPSYLIGREQCVKNSDRLSMFELILFECATGLNIRSNFIKYLH